jgi:putative aldouronate transport system permease protein
VQESAGKVQKVPSEGFYGWFRMVKTDWKKHYPIYLMVIPVVVFYIVWSYLPMYGIQIAFRDFSPRRGISGSEWVGLTNFTTFFDSVFAWRVIRNTFLLSFYNMVWGFPVPIIFALMLNEVRNILFKRTVQTITYMPFFISLVVVCGIFINFSTTTGVFGQVQMWMGRNPINLFGDPALFRTMFNITEIWQSFGFGSIIFLAALSAVSPELYEAAKIDGASRLRQIWHISVPGILPTITILLVLRIGSLMSVSFERALLLQNAMTMEVADVISTFVYRRGLINFDFGLATAAGLFNSVINFGFLLAANKFANKITGTGLW